MLKQSRVHGVETLSLNGKFGVKKRRDGGTGLAKGNIVVKKRGSRGTGCR